MNRELFDFHYKLLLEILDTKIKKISNEEFNHKKDKLNGVYNKMVKGNYIDDEFYSLSHEIRSFGFFFNNGEIRIAKDSKNEEGPDITFKDRYKIECTVCTAGSKENKTALKKSGYQVYNKVIDYNEKFKQISLRVTNSIKYKKEQFEKYLNKNEISSKDCCIIFLNMGPLATEWFAGELCFEATRFLVGRGFPKIMIDKKTGKQIGSLSYSYIPEITNNNNAPVKTNIFADKSYSIISAVIISSATLESDYNYENTIIFLNPFTKNKIRVTDFNKFPYWNMNNKFEYVPRINGKRQKLSEREIF